MSEDSVATTPTMWATGSLSITEKVKGDSSNCSGAASAATTGLGIHSICKRQVEDFWGRPLSTALIWEKSRGTRCCVTLISCGRQADHMSESSKKKSKYNKYDSGIILKKHCSGSINHWVFFFFDKYFILSLIHGHNKKKKNVVFNDTENVLCKVLLWFFLFPEGWVTVKWWALSSCRNSSKKDNSFSGFQCSE